ncbi:hypothetical protein [Piscinibacter sakaiensis]|uniref:hypothetical protein n=1 Tax=Piscinibacter sakaiensis TaxID=1547922 RepID=UPI003AAE128D
MLLLTGMAIGAGGVVFVQERYLPPRLTASASTELRAALAKAEADRSTLRAELDATTGRLEQALADKKALDDELSGSRQTIDSLREDVALILDALPPDPRGGAVEVRAGRFSVESGNLVYDVMLTRDRSGAKPFNGVMQLVLAGQNSHINMKPVPVSMTHYQGLRGSMPLPADFRPSEATIRVLDRPDGRQLGMRVLLVK